MDWNLSTAEWIVVGISAFLLVWFFLAGIYNRQRGLNIYRWLRRGLERIGKISHAQWMGSSGTGATLQVAKAGKPFRSVEAVYLLEPRELLPYWIFTRLRGRRDDLIIKAILRRPPVIELETGIGKAAKAAQQLLKAESDYQQVTVAGGFTLTRRGPQGDRIENGIGDLLGEYGRVIRRISVQKSYPHVTIWARVGPALDLSAERFFEGLMDWLQE